MRVRILVSSPSDNRSLIRPFGPPSPLRGGRLGTGGPMWPPLRANQNISRRAGEDTRPYGVFNTGSVCSVNLGAVVEPHQRKFMQTQGPVARREFRPATQILRAGNSAPCDRYASPVMGVRG